MNKWERKLYFQKNKGKLIKRGTIALSVILLIVGVIYITYSKFDSKAEWTLINGKVVNNSGDFVIAFNVDGKKVSTRPEENGEYFYVGTTCTNGTTIEFTNDNKSEGAFHNLGDGGTTCTMNYAHPEVRYYLDNNESTEEIATSHYFYTASCDKNANIRYKNNSYQISNVTEQNTSCEIYFTTESQLYLDGVIASAPELYQGLVPVKYVNNEIVIADTTQEWYNYDSHEWANAVIPTETARNKNIGDTLQESEILQMYVWIPRYRYLLWNADNGSSDEQMISIAFEDKNTTKSTGSTNGTWLTHPAFTFGNTELNGIWVGKFETGYNGATDTSSAQVNTVDATKVIIKPNAYSWRNIKLGNIFNTSRGIETTSTYNLNSSEIDTHMMKNMEWGAVAYLSHSKYGRYNSDGTCVSSGCEVWKNNNKSYTTGCSGDSVSAGSASTCNTWNTTNGMHASTTDNMYGVYDMSGGAYEYVMGNVAQNTTTYTYTVGESGLSTMPESKYIDTYTNPENSNTAHKNGKLGDATKETLKTFGNTSGGWYSDYAYFPYSSGVWFIRGGNYIDVGSGAGAFGFSNSRGAASSSNSFRVVLTAQ